MRTLLQRVALLFGLASLCLATAIAIGASRQLIRGGDELTTAVEDQSDVTGSIGARKHGLPLSQEQRGHIFDGIMRVHDAPVADVPPPAPAAVLPRSVALQELPASVIHDIPIVQGYKFVKLDDWILLVSPVDRSVVAQMPRYRTIMD